MKKIYFLLAMLILTVSSAWGQTAQLVSGYGDPLTLTQFKALAGTSGRFAFVASSNTAADNAPRCDHWCKFTSTHNTTTLDGDAVFFLEEGTGSQAGQYRVKRSSDNKYVQTSTSATSFVASGGSYFKLVNRNPNDATKAVTGDKSISFEDPSNSSMHYNANAVKYNNGAGAWTTYAVFGPFYVVTINCIDSKTKESIQVMENAIMLGGSFPSITDYILTTDPTSGAGITADGVYEFEFTKATKVENTYKYVLGGKEIASYTFQDEKDIAPAGMLTLPSYVTLESTDAPEVCTETPSTFTYNVQYNNLPFELGTPYSLTIRDDATPQYNIYVDPANETKVKTIRSTNEKWTTPTLENFNYFNWVMGGDFYNGFTFQNVATGKYLTYGENVSPADNTTSTIIDEPNAGAKFILSIKNNRNCFKIKGTTNNTFINKRADDLSTWASSNADGETGSAITFCEPIEVYSTTVDLNLTDDAGNVFSATVSGKAGTVPHLTGAEGYTLSEEVWDGSTLTAKITFPFPTSSDQVKNPTCIQSALGESKWRANSSGYLKANNKANTNPSYSNQNNWNWYIYPSLSEDGVFSFQIYNVGAEKYIPTITTTNLNTETALSDEPGSYQFMQVRTDQAGFYQAASGKFLTINTSGTNQNIWLWTAGGGHMGSTMSFPDAIVVTLEEMQAKLAALANTTKFELVEGATVISPSEYAAPSEINAAIDAANQVDSNDGIAIENFLSSDDANKIKQFNNASTSYGAPLTTNYVANAGYNTIILPVNWTIPENWKVYSCAETEGNVLTLVEKSTATKNRPYIIKTEDNETFQFIGYNNGADTENVQTYGILAGANFATSAPADAYVFNGTDRFNKVYEETEIAANNCWITLDSKAAYLLFEAEPTPEIPTATMRITDAGWATFYAPFAVEIPAGVKAYTGEMQEGWIRMNELTEGYIPASTGVVLELVEGEPFSTNMEPMDPQPNKAAVASCYTGNIYDYNITVETGDYLLQKQNDVVGWYKVMADGFTLAPNRCYLAKGSVPEPNQSRTFFGFAPDDATGINSIATEAKTKADGKYMVNGQIVVVKAGKAYYMNGTEVK